MFTVGCSLGPVLHYWYLWLDGVFVGKALKTVGKKVLVDQVIASPFLGMWYFVGEKYFIVYLSMLDFMHECICVCVFIRNVLEQCC